MAHSVNEFRSKATKTESKPKHRLSGSASNISFSGEDGSNPVSEGSPMATSFKDKRMKRRTRSSLGGTEDFIKDLDFLSPSLQNKAWDVTTPREQSYFSYPLPKAYVSDPARISGVETTRIQDKLARHDLLGGPVEKPLVESNGSVNGGTHPIEENVLSVGSNHAVGGFHLSQSIVSRLPERTADGSQDLSMGTDVSSVTVSHEGKSLEGTGVAPSAVSGIKESDNAEKIRVEEDEISGAICADGHPAESLVSGSANLSEEQETIKFDPQIRVAGEIPEAIILRSGRDFQDPALAATLREKQEADEKVSVQKRIQELERIAGGRPVHFRSQSLNVIRTCDAFVEGEADPGQKIPKPSPTPLIAELRAPVSLINSGIAATKLTNDGLACQAKSSEESAVSADVPVDRVEENVINNELHAETSTPRTGSDGTDEYANVDAQVDIAQNLGDGSLVNDQHSKTGEDYLANDTTLEPGMDSNGHGNFLFDKVGLIEQNWPAEGTIWPAAEKVHSADLSADNMGSSQTVERELKSGLIFVSGEDTPREAFHIGDVNLSTKEVNILSSAEESAVLGMSESGTSSATMHSGAEQVGKPTSTEEGLLVELSEPCASAVYSGVDSMLGLPEAGLMSTAVHSDSEQDGKVSTAGDSLLLEVPEVGALSTTVNSGVQEVGRLPNAEEGSELGLSEAGTLSSTVHSSLDPLQENKKVASGSKHRALDPLSGDSQQDRLWEVLSQELSLADGEISGQEPMESSTQDDGIGGAANGNETSKTADILVASSSTVKDITPAEKSIKLDRLHTPLRSLLAKEVAEEKSAVTERRNINETQNLDMLPRGNLFKRIVSGGRNSFSASKFSTKGQTSAKPFLSSCICCAPIK